MRFVAYFIVAIFFASIAIAAKSTNLSGPTEDLYLAVIYGLIVLTDIAYSLGRTQK